MASYRANQPLAGETLLAGEDLILPPLVEGPAVDVAALGDLIEGPAVDVAAVEESVVDLPPAEPPPPVEPIITRLRPAAQHLYNQFEHLEVGYPPDGLSAKDLGYPIAVACAALAAPIEDLYALLALPAQPWEPAFDLDAAPGWILPWVANFSGIELPDRLPEQTMRLRLREADARQRGTIGAMVQRATESVEPGGAVFFQEREPTAYRMVMAVHKPADQTLLIQRVLEVKPGGVVLELDTSPGNSYAIVRAAYDSYTDVLAKRASYTALRDTVPV